MHIWGEMSWRPELGQYVGLMHASVVGAPVDSVCTACELIAVANGAGLVATGETRLIVVAKELKG